MLKSLKRTNKKASSPRLVAAIKNGMTDQEMNESGDDWANHQGAYMTLAEVLAVEQAKQKK